MDKKFYFSKNGVALLLIFATVLSFVFFIDSLLQLSFFLISSMVGVSFTLSCFSYIKFKGIISLLYPLSLYGFFVMNYWQNSPLMALGVVFLGLGFGGLIYSALIEQSMSQKTKSKGFNIFGNGLFITCSLILSFFLLSIFKTVHLVIAIAFCVLLYCVAMICITKPTLIPYTYMTNEHKRHKLNRVKIGLFFFIISISATVIWSVLSVNSKLQNQEYFLIMLGLIAGPILAGFFSRKKGIYSGCVLLIFLAEFSLMCASLYNHIPLMHMLGYVAFGSLVTGAISLCPGLTFYLLGPISFYQNLSKTMMALLSGFSFIYPMSLVSVETLTSTQLTLWTILLLLGSFFTLFSAWSHRLVLLK